MTTITKPTRYLSVDAEVGGQLVGIHPLLQFGMVLMDEDENLVFKKDYYFQPPNYNPQEGVTSFYKSFDPNCLNDFWLSKNPALLEIIFQNAKPIQEAIHDFIIDFEALESQYHLIIVCDNPALDYGFINFYLSVYAQHRPLNIDSESNFRILYDARSYAMGAVRKEFNHVRLSAKNIAYWLEFQLPQDEHNHIASDDAQYTLKLFLRTKKHLLSRVYTTETGVHWF